MKKSIEQYLKKNKGNLSEATIDLLVDACDDMVQEDDRGKRVSISMRILNDVYEMTKLAFNQPLNHG